MKKPAHDPLAAHAETLAAWAAWLRLQQRHEASVKDHREKLKPFLCFLDERGHTLDEVDGRVIADYQAHLFECISAKTGQALGLQLADQPTDGLEELLSVHAAKLAHRARSM